uniref:Olfactomedin-like domain-containing protein n=1 Tax=Varanus komodoensis TaxID=61221 RepID=A0A8D2ISJ0_VARKO
HTAVGLPLSSPLAIFCLSYQVIVESGHIQKVLGVKDASGQCICSMELAHVIFPARKVEQLESDFYNLTNHLQNNLNKVRGSISLCRDTGEFRTINTIDTLVTKMEKYDRNNIITAQREVTTLRKKLEDCEEIHSKTEKCSLYFPTGTCDRGMLIKVSAPVLVKLNWKGSEFKAGSWGKDFAMGTKFPDHYWVFPANKDERTLETYRLYSSYKKLLLYSPIREYTLNINSKPTCENCGQGGGVIFFNGSFFYNCFDSRSLCKADPFSMRVTQMELEDQDPASFNNWFSYKGVKYQDMDMAGDEKGLWMVHGSTLANGNMVIRKVDPETLKTGTPWITSQPKEKLSNSFMICGMLYATRRKNSTHEEIYYVYDTNTSQERNIQIYMEKPLPTVQSMSYNPNDQKLYMFNDAYLHGCFPQPIKINAIYCTCRFIQYASKALASVLLAISAKV